MKQERLIFILFLIFLIISSALIFSGYYYYQVQKNNLKISTQNQIQSIAHLKVEEINIWRNERLNDAYFYYNNEIISNFIKQYLKNPEDKNLNELIYNSIIKSVLLYKTDFDKVFLFDKLGKQISSYPSKNEIFLLSKIKNDFLNALQTKQIQFSDFYREEYSSKAYIAIIVPILDMQNNKDVIGVLLLRIDPEKFLYPFIQTWPTEDKTAETLLIKKEGNEIVFLNELKFQKNTALNLRIPLDKTEVPAVQAALGYKGSMEGIDYRGNEVFAYIDKIPDSPWFIVAKINKSEAYSPLRESLTFLVLFIFTLIVSLFFILSFIWRRQTAIFYKIRYENEKEKAWLQKILTQSLNEIYIFNNKDYKFIYFNDTACNNIGYSSDELYNMTPVDIKPEFTMESFKALVQPLINKEKEKILFDTVHKRKDGTLYNVEVHLQYMDRGNNDFVFVAIINDITERKKMEEELKRSNTELEKFAYVTSHDLQEPLRMISNYIMLLEKRYKDKLDGDANDFINFAVEGVKRMQQLINDLLAYSRVGRADKKLEDVDMEEVLENAIFNLKMAINENKAKIKHDKLPVIKANKLLMTQVLQNLIGNAIKFRSKKTPVIYISAKLEKNNWVFLVQDNGIGIDPQYFERIFLIFQRLQREDYPGTGAGLAIVKRIIELHNGKIWIESEPGKGSTFYFTIPLISVK
ncbi:MAG: ATP-binding protein [Actinobacteria bacterium]|nr:ATP-binding protein [Cyanobacteriota bacterium]MCL5771300.1 ATP-binding protein [Actinomycetota bacterium]